MTRFTGQSVLVTGAANGMGAGHARAFVDEGANVLIADVDDVAGQRLADELASRGRFCHLDVRRPEQWNDAVAAAEAAFGPVSVLVNNAGVAPVHSSIENSDPDDWRRVIDTNLTGTYLGIRAVAPSMRRAGGGAIVNVSSVAGFTGTAHFGPYVASKWAIRGLTRTAATELGSDDIRVNSIHPGLVSTPMTERADVELMTARLAIPRAAEPLEITRLVLFVASPEASFSTGSEFVADGGQLLGPTPDLASRPSADR